MGIFDTVYVVGISFRYDVSLEPPLHCFPLVIAHCALLVYLNLELHRLFLLLCRIQLCCCLLILEWTLTRTICSHSTIEKDCSPMITTSKDSVILLVTRPARIHLDLSKMLMYNHSIWYVYSVDTSTFLKHKSYIPVIRMEEQSNYSFADLCRCFLLSLFLFIVWILFTHIIGIFSIDERLRHFYCIFQNTRELVPYWEKAIHTATDDVMRWVLDCHDIASVTNSTFCSDLEIVLLVRLCPKH